MTTDTSLYRLFAWLSPVFPIGAFSYSHGLEAEAAAGTVHDRVTLQAWIAAMLRHGSGRIDADLLRDAHRAAASGNADGIVEANCRGCAYRATAELALESAAQGEAFTATVDAAWRGPGPPIADAMGPSLSRNVGEGVCHAVAVGVAAARAGASLETVLILYLQGFAANLMSAGLRLGIVGQTDGQRILAALEPVVTAAASASLARDPEDFGAAAFAADLTAMAHETQYT
ncbi:MAG: urease accessory protein UreF, partial [Stellaceae bacterium]